MPKIGPITNNNEIIVQIFWKNPKHEHYSNWKLPNHKGRWENLLNF